MEVSGYIQFGTTLATLSKLIVAEDLTLRGPAPEESTDAPVLAVSELTVDSEATLTVGTSDNPLQLRVPLTKSDDMDSMDDFTVKGTSTGTGAVWIVHLATTDERGANKDCSADPVVPGFLLHESDEYLPDAMNRVNHEDCVMITGGGRILNDVYAVAAGHVCVDLGTIGSLTVVGSLSENPSDYNLSRWDDGGCYRIVVNIKNAVTAFSCPCV